MSPANALSSIDIHKASEACRILIFSHKLNLHQPRAWALLSKEAEVVKSGLYFVLSHVSNGLPSLEVRNWVTLETQPLQQYMLQGRDWPYILFSLWQTIDLISKTMQERAAEFDICHRSHVEYLWQELHAPELTGIISAYTSPASTSFRMTTPAFSDTKTEGIRGSGLPNGFAMIISAS